MCVAAEVVGVLRRRDARAWASRRPQPHPCTPPNAPSLLPAFPQCPPPTFGWWSASARAALGRCGWPSIAARSLRSKSWPRWVAACLRACTVPGQGWVLGSHYVGVYLARHLVACLPLASALCAGLHPNQPDPAFSRHATPPLDSTLEQVKSDFMTHSMQQQLALRNLKKEALLMSKLRHPNGACCACCACCAAPAVNPVLHGLRRSSCMTAPRPSCSLIAAGLPCTPACSLLVPGSREQPALPGHGGAPLRGGC